MKRPPLPPRPLTLKAKTGGPRPSPPYDKQQLLRRLESCFSSLKSQRSRSQSGIPSLDQTPIWRRTQWLYGKFEWSTYNHSYLPARYKWSYTLRQMPDLMMKAIIVSIACVLKELVHVSSTGTKQTPERSPVGRFLYDALLMSNETMLAAVNDTIRLWGQNSTSTGPSKHPTFTGDREITYASFDCMGGCHVSRRAVVLFFHPCSPGANMTKRLRALEGEVFDQKSSWKGTFRVQIP